MKKNQENKQKEKTKQWEAYFQHIGDSCGKPVIIDLESLFKYCYKNEAHHRDFGPHSLTVTYLCEMTLQKFLNFGHSLHVLGFFDFLQDNDPTLLLFKEIFKNNLEKLAKEKIIKFSFVPKLTITDLNTLNPSCYFILNGNSLQENSLIHLTAKALIPIYLLEDIQIIKHGINSYSLKVKNILYQEQNDQLMRKNTFDYLIYKEFLKEIDSNSNPLLFACFKLSKEKKEPYLTQMLFLYTIFKDLISISNRSFQFDLQKDELSLILGFYDQISSILLGITDYDSSVSNDLISSNLFLYICKFFSNNSIQLNDHDNQIWKLISGESNFVLKKTKDFTPPKNDLKMDEKKLVIHEIENEFANDITKDLNKENFIFDKVTIEGKKFLDVKHWHSDNELLSKENPQKYNLKYGTKTVMYVENVLKCSSFKGETFNSYFLIGEEKIYPNTSIYLQNKGWVPKFQPQKKEFIIVEFNIECMIDQILIFETFNPGALSKIFAIVDGKDILIYKTKPNQDLKDNKTSRILTIDINTKEITKRYKFEFLPTKEFQIDAIKIKGTIYKKSKLDENSQVQKLMNFYQKYSQTLGNSKAIIKSTSFEIKEEKTSYLNPKEKKKQLEIEKSLIEKKKKENIEQMNNLVKEFSKLNHVPTIEEWKVFFKILFKIFNLRKEINDYVFNDNDSKFICKGMIYMGFKDDIKGILKVFECKDILDYLEKNESEFQELNCSKIPFYRSQMKYLSHDMKRQTESVSDPRVAFLPDRWQKDLLDMVDNQKTALIIAPTSSGKTFISYYAMKHAIENNRNKKSKSKQIVVMVVPTKALVNQVAADIYSQYEDVFGVFTREQRKNVENCSILVTIPQCLEILFFSPTRESWMNSIKYVIFDEVHLIGSDEGEVWERLIQFCPCPFLALSATIGAVEDFKTWLRKINKDIEVIHHPSRYSDIENWMYSKNELHYVHPLAFIDEYSKNLTEYDLTPKELEELYTSVQKISKSYDHLSPESFFKDSYQALSRKDCDNYGKFLIESLQDMRKKESDTFLKVIKDISKPLENIESPDFNEFIDLITLLKKKDLLPCIGFSFSKKECMTMATKLNEKLIKAEFNELKENNCLNILTIIDNYRKKRRMEEMEKISKTSEKISMQDLEKKIEQIPPDLEKRYILYHQIKKKYRYSINEYKYDPENFWFQRLYYKVGWDNTHPLIKCLERGIGVHTSDMPIHYRNLVEVLFREKKICIVFATGTLAFGINMPCRTTIFISNSRFLTPLMYHQMRGRSGRRGYDKFGTSIFFKLATREIGNLLNGKLPPIYGNETLSVSLVLRIFNLNSQSKTDLSPRLKKLIYESIDSKPKDLVSLYFKYSIEFLIKMNLLDHQCHPMELSEMILHLHYEPGIYLLLKIFQSDEFSKLCDQFLSNKEVVTKKILLIICHLCNHVPVERGGNSLENLDPIWEKMITQFNNEIIQDFSQFMKLYDREINIKTPLSNEGFEVKPAPKEYQNINDKLNVDKNIKIRSPFISICGKTDIFDSLSDLIDYTEYYSYKMIPAYVPKTKPSPYAFVFYLNGSFSKLNMIEFNMRGTQAFNSIKAFNLTLQVLYQTLKSYFEIKVIEEVKKEEESLDWNDFQEDSITDDIKVKKLSNLNQNILYAIKHLADDYNLKFRQAEEEDFHNYLEKFEKNDEYADDELDF